MQLRIRGKQSKRGSTSVVAIFAVVLVAGMSVGMLLSSMSSKRERTSAEHLQRALYTADAGVAHAVANLSAGTQANIGSAKNPVQFSGGDYFATITAGADETFVVTSSGTYSGSQATIEAVNAFQAGEFEKAATAFAQVKKLDAEGSHVADIYTDAMEHVGDGFDGVIRLEMK